MLAGHNARVFRERVLQMTDAAERYSIEFDGFTGTVIGSYTTLEGKEGVVLQQDGTRVVHVYGRKNLKPAPVAANASAELSKFANDLAAKQEPLGVQISSKDLESIYIRSEPSANASAEARLREALNVATNIIMANAPGDSRAVSDIEVALCAASCGDLSEPVMAVIREVHLSQRSHAGEPTESEGGVESDTHSQRGRLSHVGSAKVQRPETSLAGIKPGPSDRTADVTEEDLTNFVMDNAGGQIWRHEAKMIARALLGAFTVGRR